MQTDFDSLNPTHVSDPQCWLIGDVARQVSIGINRQFRWSERASGRWLEQEMAIWNISNDVA